MRNHKKLILLLVSSAVLLGLLTTASPTFAASEQVLYSFCPSGRPCPDGSKGEWLIRDASGNLYGTTLHGGYGHGTVFELILTNGTWTEKVLHNFTQPSLPNSLIMDASGNLYGTTLLGGAYCHHTSGCGTVFELVPNNGMWTEKVLHSFNGTDGSGPTGLIMDNAGNLYGTSGGGGVGGFGGSVFELIPNNGQWTEKVLYRFNISDKKNGYGPNGGLVFDAVGNLYGTTEFGGTGSGCSIGCGVVFELTPSNGTWTEKVLHGFSLDGKDGAYPFVGLIWDTAGNLYGTTSQGGVYLHYGTVFQLTPSNGKWAEQILHSFNLDFGKDGVYPLTLVFDGSGNLYGTTEEGGTYVGTVFELIPNNGKWTEQILHNFGNGIDAAVPSSLIMDAAGNLYGATAYGGADSRGAVFEITP